MYISGIVIDGAIQGATVCLDLNRNGDCDSNEPASGLTDAQGRYSIVIPEGDTSDGPLVAMVPASAIDADSPGAPVGKLFKLSTPAAGNRTVISPITTLIQAGIAQGLTKPEAEAAVAAQLQIAAASLYSNYTAHSPDANPSLAALASSIVASLQAATPVVVSTPATAAADYHVRTLTFADANNYSLRIYYAPNAPTATGLYTFYDLRTGRTQGNPTAAGSLYDSALQGSPQGWVAVTGALPNTLSGGSPSVMNYGGGYRYTVMREETDVAGRSIAEVVRLAQDTTVNTSSTLVGVNAAALAGAMPIGAKVQKFTSVGTATPVLYRASDGFVATPVTTLAGLVAAYPAPTAPTPANTASMGALHGSAGCGAAVCPQEFLRVAFGAGNAANYFLCDLDLATGAQSNCSAAASGTYTLGKAADNSTPILAFAGVPPAASAQAFTRVFVERGGHVYFGYQDRTTTLTQTRLNRVAFEALTQALGITPPTFRQDASAYVGAWTAAYSGDDTGSCPTGAIDALGYLSGSCASTLTGQSFIVSGVISPTGTADFTSYGGSSTGARFTGTLSGNAGSGTWTLPIPLANGTWTAAKVQ